MAAQPPRYEEKDSMPAPFNQLETVPNDPREKEQPEFRIRVFPPEALVGHTTEFTCVNDTIATLINRDSGDATATENRISPRAYTKVAESEDEAISMLLTPKDRSDHQDDYKKKFAGIDRGGVAWSGQAQFDDIYNLMFVELTTLYREGATVAATAQAQKTNSTISGFCLTPSVEPFNCTLAVPETAIETWRAVQGDSKFPAFNWIVTKPTTEVEGALANSELAANKGWEMVQEYNSLCTGLQFTRQLPDATAEVVSEKPLVANQQFCFEIEWQGKALQQTLPARWRLSWGNGTYSILFVEGAVPTIDKMERGAWVTWRNLEGFKPIDFSQQGIMQVAIARLAGKMVVKINEQGWCIADARRTSTVSDANGQWTLQECTWPKGKVRISTFGSLFSMRSFNRYMFRKPGNPGNARLRQQDDFHYTTSETVKEGNKTTTTTSYWKYGWGLFARRRKQLVVADEGMTTHYERSGWHSSSAFIRIAGKVDLADVKYGFAHEIYYVAVLRANKDGIDTPFISSMQLEIGMPESDVDAPPIDVGPCMIAASESSSEPTVTNSADWSIQLHPDLLDLEFGVDSQGNGLWERYIQHWNFIEFAVRWRYTNGTYSPWATRLRGHIVSQERGSDGPNRRTLSIRAQDPLLRITGNAGKIDHRFAPLDFYYAQRGGGAFFGAEAIYYMLRNGLSRKEANKLNGNTTGNEPSLAVKLKYFMPDHYPLLSPQSDGGGFLALQWSTTGSPSSSTGVWMPPWGQSLIDWTTQVANQDFALLYYGFPGGYSYIDDDWTGEEGASVCPIYGHYYTIMRNRPTWRVADANYIEGDLNVLLKSASWSDLPEWQINEVLVWNNAGERAHNLPFPAVIQGAARLDSSFPESSAHSWRRQLIMQEEKMYLPGAAQALATWTMIRFQNEYIRRVTLEFVGEERISWGDKIVPMMVNYQDANFSPKFLKLSGEVFRIVRVGNRYDDNAPGVDGFTTVANCAPFNERME